MEFAKLDNPLINDAVADDLPVEEEAYSGNRVYDPGPNTGQYGYVEVEQDGVMMQCTNAYTSNSYGGMYCVGDTFTDPNGGSQTIRAINPTGIDLAPAQWDAEETYSSAGEQMGMTLEEWTEFSAEVQELNEVVDSLKGNMMGPTEQQIGRLGIRISQENPDWTEAEVMAEANRMLAEEWKTSDAYREAALAETALFAKYGITKPNPAVYGSGVWIGEDGKYHKFESSSGNFYQTSQDDGILDVAVPIGIGIVTGIITGGAASALTSSLLPGLSSVASGALNSAIASAGSTLLQGGELTLEGILKAAALGGASTAILNEIQAAIQGGDSVLSDISDWIGKQADKLQDQQVVTFPDGSTFIEQAGGWIDEAGNFVESLPAGGTSGTISGILGQGGSIPDWVWDAASAVVDVVDEVSEAGEGNGTGEAGGATTLPGTVEEEEEVVEEEEEVVDILDPPEEVVEEEEDDILTQPEVEVEEEDDIITQPEVEVEEEEEEVVEIIDDSVVEEEEDDIIVQPPVDDPVEEVEEEEEETVVTEGPPGGPTDDPGNAEEEDEVTVVVDPPVSEPPGGGGGGGMLGGNKPIHTDPFGYTNITQYQKKPTQVYDYINKKGMLS